MHQLFGKSFGIYRIVAVVKPVSYLCARIVFNHGAAHGELIEVVVGKMCDNLSHVLIVNRG